ncbi:hypothetical protein HELRODRAFT_193054 [Helobdella robusta]|uniref:Uncharacterized protein n=1 Tax=Helobdella robusta TaxID=6412 RepID=T1FUK7_HELRO|nr:hypothetical protein HELRODRAFT_193054 [Helobdella robusta]ESN98350.1 hypothetical protein HELRODRAFT_193054 [Helobdella robusta]
MKELMNKSTWDQPFSLQSWCSVALALCASIFFFAAYGGTSWWVEYYPRPDGLIAIEPRSMGLFRMCIRGDCIFDLTNRRLVAQFVPQEYKEVSLLKLPCSQWLMSFNVAFIIILFVVYLGFLAGSETYFAQVWLQILISQHQHNLTGILTVISMAVYGAFFRGSRPTLPFGWSYWLALVAAVLFLINAIFIFFITLSVRKHVRMSPMKLYVLQDQQQQQQQQQQQMQFQLQQQHLQEQEI